MVVAVFPEDIIEAPPEIEDLRQCYAVKEVQFTEFAVISRVALTAFQRCVHPCQFEQPKSGIIRIGHYVARKLK